MDQAADGFLDEPVEAIVARIRAALGLPAPDEHRLGLLLPASNIPVRA